MLLTWHIIHIIIQLGKNLNLINDSAYSAWPFYTFVEDIRSGSDSCIAAGAVSQQFK